MVDVVHARNDGSNSRVKSHVASLSFSEYREGIPEKGKGPRSDVGTILLHWLIVVAMLTSLFTGLRISADAREAVISKFLSPILPQGEVWTYHFLAGLALFFCLSAYVVYMGLSGLTKRNALNKARALGLPGAGAGVRKARWGAVNVLLHWLMYAIVVVMTATGIALYLGHGGWIVAVHAACALTALAYIFVHVTTHFLYGGWQQLLRLFKPAPLASAAVARRRPLLVASVVGLPVIIGLGAYDFASRDTLTVHRVAAAPVLANLLDDAAWKGARPVFIHTMQGANMGGSGESTVDVRAVHDDSKIYFAFHWQDPSRSLRRIPMVKQADGWHVTDPDTDKADVVGYYEDKFAVIFSRSDAFGTGGMSHLGPRPLADKPAPLNKRGFHYTTDGSTIDLWQWKSSRGGMLGFMEDMYVGPPTEPTPAEAAVKARYQAGYWGDPGKSMYRYNFPFEPPGGYAGPITPMRLPKDYKAVMAGLGKVDPDPDASVEEGSKWWMFEDADTVPYSKEADDQIPVGAMMPGVLIIGEYTDDRAGIQCAAKWKDGYWTLVASRDLKTGSKYDVDFDPGSRFYMWVAAYDHTQTRHTRHMRPVVVDMR
jgi:cytochrome b subunit of formate dehydrogenase